MLRLNGLGLLNKFKGDWRKKITRKIIIINFVGFIEWHFTKREQDTKIFVSKELLIEESDSKF